MEPSGLESELLIRPLTSADFAAFNAMTQHAGHGITSLVPNEVLLKDRLNRVEDSFHQRVSPNKRFFLFGLERLSEQKLIGIAGIKLCTGYKLPFYNYKLSSLVQRSRALNKTFNHRILCLVNDYQYAAELCSLFLLPEYRRGRRGAFLSRARFLFMANYLEQFPQRIIAEMRGVCDAQGRSPFWDGLVKPFFDMSFSEADYLTTAQNKQFIADLMPCYPIYVDLLNEAAQAVIGKSHPETMPAYHFFMREQFHYHDYIDIFDGGPVLEASVKEILSIKRSQVRALAKVKSSLAQPILTLICNIPEEDRQSEFKAVLRGIEGNSDSLMVDESTARILNAEVGSNLRVCPLHL